MKPDPTIAPILAQLRECMCQYLSNPDTSPLGGPPCSCCLVWSDQPYWDGCDCECVDGSNGRAYIRYVNSRGLVSGNQVGPYPRCPTSLDVTIELGIVRCYAIDPDGAVPACDVLEAEAHRGLADLFALRRIVACCSALPKNRWRVEDAVPLGPMGGCMGATLTVAFQAPW